MLIPPLNDFPIILSEVGQPITIRSTIRTINKDGKTTNISNNDVSTFAVVDEFKKIEIDVNGVERYVYGDVRFSVLPNVGISQFDKIVWKNMTYIVKNMRDPPYVAGVELFKIAEAARENTNL